MTTITKYSNKIVIKYFRTYRISQVFLLHYLLYMASIKFAFSNPVCKDILHIYWISLLMNNSFYGYTWNMNISFVDGYTYWKFPLLNFLLNDTSRKTKTSRVKDKIWALDMRYSLIWDFKSPLENVILLPSSSWTLFSRNNTGAFIPVMFTVV